jgi:23S rRNA pseudouridine2605 synthase
MRINKYLSACELGSRRKVEEFVLLGRVKVNGKVVTQLSFDVSDNDLVEFNNKVIKPQSKKVYLMLNKPKCYITSLKDEKDRRVVTDLLKNCKEKVFPVGRLDYNTEGLLLFTNDGDWANNIIHPSHHIPKTYEVKTKVELLSKQIMQINNGIVLDGKKTLPARIKLIDFKDDFFVYNITIYEGRNREIRRMFEYINVKIYNLKRIKIGALSLASLSEGKYKYLTEEEKLLVFMED